MAERQGPDIYYEIPPPKPDEPPLQDNRRRRRIAAATAFTSVLLVAFGTAFGLGWTFIRKASTLESSNQILAKYQLIDGNNNVGNVIRNAFRNQMASFDYTNLTNVAQTDLKRLTTGYVGGQFWVAYASCDSLAKDATRIHIEQIDLLKRLISKYSSKLALITNSSQFETVYKEGKIASVIGVQSSHAIDSSLALLRIFYNLGARYMALAPDVCSVPWAWSSDVDTLGNLSVNGLSNFGRTVIQEMNRLGMIVDLSLSSYQTQLDALDATNAPVIFSHSAAYSLCNHTRNIRDDVLLRLKANKGIIMINFNSNLIACSNRSNITDLTKHFNYIKNLIGVDYIGIGAAYDDLTPYPIDGVEDVSKYPNLFAELLSQGWSENELAKVAGQNVIRVFAQVEKYATTVRNMTPRESIISQYELGSLYTNCRTSF